MSQKHQITAEKREVFGKKINKYRKEGKVPGNIYGKTIEPLPVWFSSKELAQLLKGISESALIDIKIGDEKARPVIFRDIQHEFTSRTVVHVDAQQVNLKEKIVVNIPIEIVGQSELITKGDGILETTTSEVEVEALPTDLPEGFAIDISGLTEIGQKITVSQLSVPNGVQILTDPETVLVAIVNAAGAEEEPVATSEADQIDSVDASTAKDGLKEEKKNN